MTDPRKLDAEAAALLTAPRTLKERMPEYARLFAAGIVAIAVVGAIIGAFAPAALHVSIGYTGVFAGAFMLLAGGASGGGYANLGFGIVERMTDHSRRGSVGPGMSLDAPAPSRRSRRYGVESRPEERKDPMERLRKGLRPEANPTAFWTVIGGILYIVLGVAVASF